MTKKQCQELGYEYAKRVNEIVGPGHTFRAFILIAQTAQPLLDGHTVIIYEAEDGDVLVYIQEKIQ